MSTTTDTTSRVGDGTFDDLTGRVRGDVLRPGSPGYTEACTGYNLAAVRLPDLVLRAADAADVAAAVAFAAERSMPVAVMSTGHQAGRPIEGGLLIRTGALTEVTVDRERRSARIGAGARWQDVLAVSLPLGLAPLHGSSPVVGVVGFTLGGGISPTMGRAHGWAVDHIRAIDVVTADGTPLRVAADRHPDLFWALRGGRSDFGVVTALEIDLFPVGAFAGGGLFFEGAQLEPVLAAFRALTATAPDALSTSLALLRMPPLPGVPPLLAGRFVLHLRVAFLGETADLDPLLEPVRAAAPALVDTVGPLPYERFPEIHADPVDPAPLTERGAMLRDLPADAAEALREVAGPDSGIHVEIVELRHLGGAMSREPGTGSAVDHRDARYSLWCAVVGTRDDRPDAVRDAADVVDALAPWGTGRHYLNHSAGDPLERPFTPAALERLRALRASADPHGRFRPQHVLDPSE
ncbi:FAD-binding oxidoreductase [Amnibacterium setariae]|uniref:FAD-binding oxidoreductase n=1 Tax=Amnibacterium setariae TaxID=2306585 RepID=A0A3A1TYC7_9MICO|nr:FAD-binding protein [Amnibacterium setariae]RIX28591.1 FAD-binding oxidoreductase [Amnibacterium setariae]